MKGAYVLGIRVKKDCAINIGALGRVKFETGYYAYVGSAMNSLEARIARHFRPAGEKKLHWHIDFLLANPNVRLERAFFSESKSKEECEIAARLASKGETVKGFGCSDCSCEGHLFKIGKPQLVAVLKGFGEFK